MSRKVVIGCLLYSFVMVSANASEDNHTVSFGYAQGKVKRFKNIRGINAQYRYEWNSPASIIGSFTYLKGNKNHSTQERFSSYAEKENIKYYSLLAGPAYRFNNYVSLYALVGLAHTKLEYSGTENAHYSGKNIYNTVSFAYGAGIVVNPIENVSVNIGYEGTYAKYNENILINGVNIGVGYRF